MPMLIGAPETIPVMPRRVCAPLHIYRMVRVIGRRLPRSICLLIEFTRLMRLRQSAALPYGFTGVNPKGRKRKEPTVLLRHGAECVSWYGDLWWCRSIEIGSVIRAGNR